MGKQERRALLRLGVFSLDSRELCDVLVLWYGKTETGWSQHWKFLNEMPGSPECPVLLLPPWLWAEKLRLLASLSDWIGKGIQVYLFWKVVDCPSLLTRSSQSPQAFLRIVLQPPSQEAFHRKGSRNHLGHWWKLSGDGMGRHDGVLRKETLHSGHLVGQTWGHKYSIRMLSNLGPNSLGSGEEEVRSAWKASVEWQWSSPCGV